MFNMVGQCKTCNFKTFFILKYIRINFFKFHVHVINVERQVGVKTSSFIKCQVKMKAYPEELLPAALGMVCLVPSTSGLERFFQQWDSSTLIFATGFEFRKLERGIRNTVFRGV